MKELERLETNNAIIRIAVNDNNMFVHQFKSRVEEDNPYGNDGWSTDFISSIPLTVHSPYPYTAPSNYYASK